MLRCYLMDPNTDVCQTEQPQISYSVDFTAEQSSAMESPILLDREFLFLCVSTKMLESTHKTRILRDRRVCNLIEVASPGRYTVRLLTGACIQHLDVQARRRVLQ